MRLKARGILRREDEVLIGCIKRLRIGSCFAFAFCLVVVDAIEK